MQTTHMTARHNEAAIRLAGARAASGVSEEAILWPLQKHDPDLG